MLTFANPSHHGLESENWDIQACFYFQLARFIISKHTEYGIEISLSIY